MLSMKNNYLILFNILYIGDEELVKEGRNGGVFLIPSSPLISIPLTLSMSDCLVHIPNRTSVEERIKESISKNITAVKEEGVEVQIISRTLKIGKYSELF